MNKKNCFTLHSKRGAPAHITAITGKLSSTFIRNYKIRFLADHNNARLVYFIYFHSFMLFDVLLMGISANIDTIFLQQKVRKTHLQFEG